MHYEIWFNGRTYNKFSILFIVIRLIKMYFVNAGTEATIRKLTRAGAECNPSLVVVAVAK